RGAVTHPEMRTFMEDGNVFAFSRTGGRGEWLPGIGPRAAQPRFLCLSANGGNHRYDRLVGGNARTFYQNWLEMTLGAEELLPQNAETAMYSAAIDALEAQGLVTR